MILLKVLVVTQGKIASGAEKVTAILYDNNKEETIVLSGSKPQLEYYSSCGFVAENVKGLIALNRQSLGFVKLVSIFKAMFPLRKKIISYKPAYIHVNNIPSLLYVTIATQGLKIPIILHVHDFYSQDKLVKLIAKFLKEKPSRIIAVSNVVKKDLEAIGFSSANIHVVHNGIEQHSTKKQVLKLKDNFNSQSVKVLFVGSIAKWKGLHVLLAAAKKLKINRHINVEYYIAGPFLDNKYENEIKTMASEIKNEVYFLGKVSNIQELMLGMDILVHCSIESDPFPTVVLEGMSSGMAVIASQSSGAQEIINHGINGMLHTPGDVDSLVGQLEVLVNDLNLRKKMSIEGCTFAKQHLNKKRYQEQFFNNIKNF